MASVSVYSNLPLLTSRFLRDPAKDLPPSTTTPFLQSIYKDKLVGDLIVNDAESISLDGPEAESDAESIYQYGPEAQSLSIHDALADVKETPLTAGGDAGKELLNRVQRAAEKVLKEGGVAGKELLKRFADNLEDLSEALAKSKAGLDLWSRTRALHEKPHPVSVQNRKEYFYGREEEKTTILGLLSNQKNGGKVKVISITGEAGAGKTALAGLIYSYPKVVRSFQLRVWVTVPQKASVCSVVKKILETVTEDHGFCGSNDLHVLLSKLEMCLAGKKFLMVLDNCWIEDDSGNWDKMISSLGFTGSALILTARPLGVEDEGFVPPADHPVPLGLLPTVDCWSIFWGYTSVVVDLGFDEDPEIEQVGQQIVDKLGNLPLAAKMVGSFLLDKDLEDWTQTLGDKLLNTRRDEISHIPLFLIMCYLDLPMALRLCFAFLSVFPKGYQFKQRQVVLLWMALGFLRPSKPSGKSMEQVGHEYFSYLTWRSFLQRSGDGASFVIHDLVHDLASYVFKHENHMSYYYGSFEALPETVSNPHLLRGILPLGRACRQLQATELEKKLSKLNPNIFRVLSLSNYGITELPPSIQELSHLYYLDLSYNALQELPESIGNLYYLQTLLLTNCTSLTSLPERVTDLASLRHLDIRGTAVQDMPPEMNRLTSLQTLTNFVVSRSSREGFKDLAGLSNIRTLAISNLHNVEDATDASFAKLKEKTSLNDLILQWGSGHDYKEIESEVLETLVPHGKIKNLSVEHYCGVEFPIWLGGELFRTLRSVKLRHCNCISLPPLGQLPGLKDLVVEGFNKVTHIGPEFCGRTGERKPFRSLESLQFREMLEWKEWRNLEGVKFQNLRELSIICCPKLVEELPKKLGSLEKLEISGCYELVALLPKMPPTCEVYVHDSNKTLMSSDVEVPFGSRRLTVPVDGKQFSSHCYSSVPSTKESHDESEEIIQEPDVTPLDAQSPPIEADDPNITLAVDPQVTDNPANTDYSKMASSSSEDERSSFEMFRVSNISHLEKKLPPKLDCLRIEECTYLEALPESLLPITRSLKELYLIDCNSLKSFPPDGFPLRTLYVSNCPNLELFSTSESTQMFKSLKHMWIRSSCDSLKVFTLNFFPKLKTLCLWDCSNLASVTISKGFQSDLDSLESLEIRDCPNLESFPDGGLRTTKMASLYLSNCDNLKNIPNSNNSLRSLQSLVLRECPLLESLSLKSLPLSLTSLSIAFCNTLTPLKSWGLYNLQYLSSFEIEGGCDEMESFPEKELLPSNLKSLRISTLDSLKKLDDNGFQHLNALQALEIDGCEKLQSLPEQGLPSSLLYLSITQSPLLTQKLSSKAGDVWRKVAHIPQIEIDGEAIC